MTVSKESRNLAALDYVLRLIISAPDDVKSKDMDSLMKDMYGLYNAIEDKEQVQMVQKLPLVQQMVFILRLEIS